MNDAFFVNTASSSDPPISVEEIKRACASIEAVVTRIRGTREALDLFVKDIGAAPAKYHPNPLPEGVLDWSGIPLVEESLPSVRMLYLDRSDGTITTLYRGDDEWYQINFEKAMTMPFMAGGEAVSEHPTITDKAELEHRLVYSLIVAGKSAAFTDAAMKRLADAFWSLLDPAPATHFEAVRRSRKLKNGDSTILGLALHKARTGNYTKIERALCELVDADLDLATVAPDALEAIHGIGPKTARFFILWTRPNERYAALDTHILKWMKARGYQRIPKSTPTGKRYAEIEQQFIAEADKRGMTPRELDHAIWDHYANGTPLPETCA
jgi:endonuclease III